MSIINPIKYNVQVCKSTDNGAPTLSRRPVAGEIKTILKGCLATGYGDHPPAPGWTMLFEDVNRAAFQSTDPRSAPGVLVVDESGSQSSIKAYQSMTDLDTGTGLWSDHLFRPYHNETSGWLLFATPVAFLLLTLDRDSNGKTVAVPLYFGAVSNAAVVDNGLAVLHHPGESGYLAKAFRSEIAYFSDGETFTGTTVGASFSGLPDYGYLAFPMHLRKGYQVRAGLPFFCEDSVQVGINEAVTTATRSVYRITVGFNGYVLQIPTDYWLI